jgi:hypothetical protein
MGIGREIARSLREGVEEGLRDRYRAKDPVTRGIVKGVYEGVTGRPLEMPKRGRPWSMRSSDGTPWSFRQDGRPRRLLTQQQIKRRQVQRLQRRLRPRGTA